MFERKEITKLVADCHKLWQMKLLKPSQLSRFAKERDVNLLEKHIIWLWQFGLLRADLVLSTEKLEIIGLIEISQISDGRIIYSDQRSIPHKPQGWTDALKEQELLPAGLELKFHTFRYYVIYHLWRILSLSIHPMQILLAEKYPSLLDQELKGFQNRSASEDYSERISYWNDIVALVVVTEPCVYETVFKVFGWPSDIGEEQFRVLVENYCELLAKFYQQLDLSLIKKIRQDLCIDAEILDANSNIHTLLRLGESRVRLKLKGRLGGAMYLKTMAEMIRRGAEQYLEIELPEEDEIGFGSWPKNAKQQLYGSNRIFDVNREVARQVVRQSLLDFGIRLRWYVEGETELGAIESIINSYPVGIQVVNLRGQVAERGGKGVAFRESLRSDKEAGVFSFITIDADRSDFYRAARKAAEDDQLCGEIYLSEPDFEFQNFTLDELEEIIWQIAVQGGATDEKREDLHQAIQNAENGDQVIRLAKGSLPTELWSLKKSKEWGERLIDFAWEHPRLPDGKIRAIVEQIETAMRVDFYDYRQTREEYRVDPLTGRLTERT